MLSKHHLKEFDSWLENSLMTDSDKIAFDGWIKNSPNPIYLPEIPPVNSSFCDPNGYLWRAYSIKIRDDGPGFDKKFIANFGKPFYSSRPEKGVNMGLGLFITKQMIENLNGEILVQSNDGAEVILTWRI